MVNMETGNPAVLWVDLTRLECPVDVRKTFSEHFTICMPMDRRDTDNAIHRRQYDALVFEYDFPDRASLQILRLTKHQNPGMPVVLVTEQHSESLAIWALHMRLWDYMVKPVTPAQIRELRDELMELRRLSSERAAPQRKRAQIHRDERIPEEYRIGDLCEAVDSLQRATDYIDAHLDQRISLDAMAKLCRMSPFRFSREFKKVFGQTFQDYLTEHRIERACQLLANPSAQVADVAYMVGFKDPSHFARTFKKLKGNTPAQYRALHKALRVTGDEDQRLRVPLEL